MARVLASFFPIYFLKMCNISGFSEAAFVHFLHALFDLPDFKHILI